MTLHRVEYSYTMPEWGSMEIDIDESLDQAEKEAFAISDIKEAYSDIADIEIDKIEVIS